jgi:uncharacterized damage-inducible protein DinB
MSEIRQIKKLLTFTFRGPAWHGPSLMENLSGLTAAQALARLNAGTHSIWEIVHHMTVWQAIATRTLGGDPYPDFQKMKPEEDWPPVNDTSENAWAISREQLEKTYEALIAAAAGFPEERLHQTVPDNKFTYYILLQGVIHHNLYHSGQIGLLKKM